MRNIYAFRKGFRAQLSHKNVTYHGPLRPTQGAAIADLAKAQAFASRAEQVKFLQEEVTARKRQLRSQQGEVAQGAGKGVDGQVPAEPQEKDMAECGAGEQQEEPVMRVGEQLEELEEAGAPAMNVGEHQEAPGTGQVAEAPARPGRDPARLFLVLKKRYFDVMVSGEKKVECREKKGHWERKLTNKYRQIRSFDYVEFQCGFTHPCVASGHAFWK